MVKRAFYVVAILAFAIALFFMFHKNDASVSIDDNKIVVHIPKQDMRTTVVKILMKRKSDDNYVTWEYAPSEDEKYSDISLPEKIYVQSNVFKLPPQINTINPINSGEYSLEIAVNRWDVSNPNSWVLVKNEDMIRLSFCVNVVGGRYSIC